ncbi:MAG: porin family protein [Methylococcales bacterium]|nr:porin family protein [Methylococcales bacterium]
MTSNKNKLGLGIVLATLTMAGALVSTAVVADDAATAAPKAAKHKVAKHKAAAKAAYAAPSKVDMLEAQLRAMQDEVAALRGQVHTTAPAASADAQKVQDLDARMATVETASAKQASKAKNHMIYFRGGYAGNDSSMVATTNNIGGVAGNITLPGTTNGQKDGWNFGAGLDFSLTDNMFGLMKGTEMLAELDLNYVDLGSFRSGLSNALLSTPALDGTYASQSMFRITAAPKIKFFEGSKLRPWIIPTGFTLNVISPPSQANAITELMPAMHFGAGLDYNIWKSIYVGTDVRYNMAFGTLNGTNVNGLTAGGSVGFGF